MDYISNKIKEKVTLNQFSENYRDAVTHEQSRLEFYLICILGYLWNKNIHSVDDNARLNIFHRICHPSIGTLIDLARSLDINSEFFGNKDLKTAVKALNEYPAIRNEKVGHGYSFEDDAANLFETLQKLSNLLEAGRPSVLGKHSKLIQILSKNELTYKGITYKPTGEITPCTLPIASLSLNVGDIYVKSSSKYERLSPFINIRNMDEFYVFSFIEDKLAGRSVYNQLIKTGRCYFETSELVQDRLEIDSDRARMPNGIIVNNYENNYNFYIETRTVNRISKFLKHNKSTVFATLWGHGGVGKTASIQRVCEELLKSDNKVFDYIVFASAKDRQLNYYNGKIEAIDASIDSYESLIRFINSIVFDVESSDPLPIIEFNGTLMLVIDDFETFQQEEKDNIVSFIKLLNVNHHKVVITTRSANYITGEEIEVEELSKNETFDFFVKSLESELGIKTDSIKNDISGQEFQDALYMSTGGRPLFIFQSAILFGETNSFSDVLDADIKSKKDSVEFLYGRIIDYLSSDSTQVFRAIGLLVTESDLSNLLQKLKFILNMESLDDRFDFAIKELTKLKLIKLQGDKYFRVYSTEIARLAIRSASDLTDGDIKNRLLMVGTDKTLDHDMSLLNDADNSRISHKIADVIQKYQSIISRSSTPEGMRITAIVNLAQYLIDDKGDYHGGIRELERYEHLYNTDYQFVNVYTSYLWRGDDEDKYKAISLIKNAIIIYDDTSEEAISLICTLMQYEALALIRSREALKDALNVGDISESEYRPEFNAQRQDFYQIYEYPGKKIYGLVRNNQLINLPHELRIKVLNGLSHFVEVAIRRNLFEEVDIIFSHVFNDLKYNYHDLFIKKLDRVNRLRKKGSKTYESYIKLGSTGDKGLDILKGKVTKSKKKSITQKRKIGNLGEQLLKAINKE
jgi:hypothetical protein